MHSIFTRNANFSASSHFHIKTSIFMKNQHFHEMLAFHEKWGLAQNSWFWTFSNKGFQGHPKKHDFCFIMPIHFFAKSSRFFVSLFGIFVDHMGTFFWCPENEKMRKRTSESLMHEINPGNADSKLCLKGKNVGYSTHGTSYLRKATF